MSPDQLSVAADISTIVACLVAIVAVVLGAYQFIATQKASQETQAVDLFLKFNQLNIEQSLSTSHVSDHWYNNSKFAITESLYNISHQSGSWANTVKWMLDQQAEFVKRGGFAVDSYSEIFRAFCKRHGYELKP